MTAKQEIKKWLKQHRQLNNDTDREQFFQSLLNTLGSKNTDQLLQGVQALRESVHTTRLKAEKANTAKKVGLLVFPKSREEQELLQQLLERMAIPFKMNS